MSDKITFTIDGVEVQGEPGQTILEAADAAGIYIPRLCSMNGLVPHGSCRVCMVTVNGKPQSACTYPIAQGILVDNDTEKLRQYRKAMIDMLFVEGNHFCMFCEKSGNCELQALAYRFGITAPQYPYMFPDREVDASHPDVFIDHNRCILCGRCVLMSSDVDGKNVFQFVGRGPHKKVGVNAECGLGGTSLKIIDKAIAVCPVGALMKKRVGYEVPIGRRQFDNKPIGSNIEQRKTAQGQ